MLQTGENETEILLGNKQLLGIFFVVAVLLGLAFTGGYMVGRGSADKKIAAVATAPAPTAPGESSANPSAAGGRRLPSHPMMARARPLHRRSRFARPSSR